MSIPTPSAPALDDNLVPVFLAQVGDVLTHVCDARTLHAFLENGDLFANWIKDRIEKYQLVENKDFILILENSKIKFNLISENTEIKKHGGDRRSKEYLLTLDTAKELAMVERNAKGRQIRRYFIDCERRLHGAIAYNAAAAQPQTAPAPEPDPEISATLQAALSYEAHQIACEGYSGILEELTERARYYLRTGIPETDILDCLKRKGFGRASMIHPKDIKPLLDQARELFSRLNDLMEGGSELCAKRLR